MPVAVPPARIGRFAPHASTLGASKRVQAKGKVVRKIKLKAASKPTQHLGLINR